MKFRRRSELATENTEITELFATEDHPIFRVLLSYE